MYPGTYMDEDGALLSFKAGREEHRLPVLWGGAECGGQGEWMDK